MSAASGSQTSRFEYFRARVPAPPTTSARAHYTISLPDDERWQASFYAFLLSLTEPQSWAAGERAAREAALLEAQNVITTFSPVEPGMIVPYVGSSPPAGCLPLAGGTYDGADYPRLWVAIPDAWKDPFGGTFTLPDADGLLLRGASTDIGEIGGSDTFTLTTANLPAHEHFYTAPSITTVTAGLEVPVPAAMVDPIPQATTTTGSGTPVTHVPAHLKVKLAITTG